MPEALDATRREGRHWRLGDNRGVVGLLLRKDFHAFFDARHVTIDNGGNVAVTLTLQRIVDTTVGLPGGRQTGRSGQSHVLRPHRPTLRVI